MAATHTIVARDPVRNLVFGTVLPTAGQAATAESVTVGFTPRYVRVLHLTRRIQLEWMPGMTDDHALKTVANGDRTHVTSLGITPSSHGFTIGLDTAVLIADEKLYFEARA